MITETTYTKENNQLNETPVSSNAVPENIDNDIDTPTFSFQKPKNIVSDTLSGDDTLTNNLLSLTLIKNFVGKFFFHFHLIKCYECCFQSLNLNRKTGH